MARRTIKKIKRTVVFLLAKSAAAMFNLPPRRLAIYLGGWVGLAVWFLSVKDRYKAYRHLTLIYGDACHPREKQAITQRFFVNSGKNLVDVLRFRKHFDDEIKPLVSCEGLEYFDDAYRQGKGLIGVTGHIGNFELLAAYVASLGYQIAVIGRELYDPRLDRLLVDNRLAVGLTNISTTDSPKRVVSWLRQGNALGVLIDTDSSRVRGEFVPAFGRWSYTPIGQTILGIKTGAAILPMACLRAENNRYRIIIKPEINVESSELTKDSVYQVTLACTRSLEEIIEGHMDQWSWQHNRWRTRRQPLES